MSNEVTDLLSLERALHGTPKESAVVQRTAEWQHLVRSLMAVALTVFGLTAVPYYDFQIMGGGYHENLLTGAVVGLHSLFGPIGPALACFLGLTMAVRSFLDGPSRRVWSKSMACVGAGVGMSFLLGLLVGPRVGGWMGGLLHEAGGPIGAGVGATVLAGGIMALGFVALTGSWPGRRSLAEASTGILMPPGESPDGVSADEEAVLLGGPGPEAEALMDGLTEYSSRLEGVMDTLGAAPDDFQDPEFQTSFLTDIPDPDVPGEEEPEFTPREAAVAVEEPETEAVVEPEPEEEIEAAVEEPEPVVDDEPAVQPETGQLFPDIGVDRDDPALPMHSSEDLDRAARSLFAAQRVSATALADDLQVSLGDASSLIVDLEKLGAIGPHTPGEPREILLTGEEWESSRPQ